MAAPPPYKGIVSINSYYKGGSYVQIFTRDNVVFRRLYEDSAEDLTMKTNTREWVNIKSVQEEGIDRVAEVTPEGNFRTNLQTGHDNQDFWFEGGFLRNKAFPKKVVAVDLSHHIGESGVALTLQDEKEDSDKQRWVYNKATKLLQSGMQTDGKQWALDTYSAHELYVHPSHGLINQQFLMVPDPFEASGETEVTAIHFDLDKATKGTTPSNICSVSQVNDSDVEQQITISQNVISTTMSTAEFHWDNETAVYANATAKVSIPFVGETGVETGVSNTTTVGGNSVTENTKQEKWEYTAPVKVPARTSIKFDISVIQAKLNVPFTATIRKGTDQWEEKGTFIGVNSFGLTTAVKQTALKS